MKFIRNIIVLMYFLLGIAMLCSSQSLVLASQQQADIGGGNTNIVLNSTFNDDSNITYESGKWVFTGGTLNYEWDDTYSTLTLSDNISSGDNLEIKFDITTVEASKNARVEISANNGADIIQALTDRGAGSYTVNVTYTGATTNLLSLQGADYGGGGTFSIDNLTLTKQ
jgi:hypothetical protein